MLLETFLEENYLANDNAEERQPRGIFSKPGSPSGRGTDPCTACMLYKKEQADHLRELQVVHSAI